MLAVQCHMLSACCTMCECRCHYQHVHPHQFSQYLSPAEHVLCRGNEVERFSSSHPDVNGEPLDIEDLVKLGQLSGPCPYLLSKEMASTADIVFMPYNYLIDAKNRMGLGKICWENAILIFDEAHNLEVYSCASFPGVRCSLNTNPYAYVKILTGLGHLCYNKSLRHDSALSETLLNAHVGSCSDWLLRLVIAVGFCKQGVCSESASFDLPAGVLASCVQEVQSALEIALVRRENGSAQRGGEIFVAGGAGTNNVVNCKQASIAASTAHAINSLSHFAMQCVA